jgi:hypothetical protein
MPVKRRRRAPKDNAGRSGEAWARLLARGSDSLVCAVITVGLGAAGLAAVNFAFHDPLLVEGLSGLVTGAFPGSVLVFYGLSLTLVIIGYDTVLLRLFGTTPGKWLMGISARGPKGVTPGYLRALHRSVLLSVVGLALNLPFVNAVTAFAAYTRLKRRGDTFWDDAADVSIRSNKVNFLRWIMAAALTSASMAGYFWLVFAQI